MSVVDVLLLVIAWLVASCAIGCVLGEAISFGARPVRERWIYDQERDA